MTIALVGHTGFVGRNLKQQAGFDALYASSNIGEIDGQRFDSLVVSAVRASMWLANSAPDQDWANIGQLIAHLDSVEARRVILISTIAVYEDPAARPDENSTTGFETVKAYGRHRRAFEEWVTDRFSHVLVLRLPALFGDGLSKNFIFDLLNPAPAFVPAPRFDEALGAVTSPMRDALLTGYRHDAAAGLWRRTEGDSGDQLLAAVDAAGLASIRFTHPGSWFQFYDLAWLWSDIEQALGHSLRTLNLATPPMSAAALARDFFGRDMDGTDAPMITQDFRSVHDRLWGRSDGYLRATDEVASALAAFVRRQRA
jgi:hypothetical protein